MQVNPRQLYRSDDDRIFAGVAGGLAAYLDVDPVIVRIIWFLSILVSVSLTFWVYVIMMIVVPLEPTEWPRQSPWAPGGGPVGYQTGYTPPAPGTAPAADPGNPQPPLQVAGGATTRAGSTAPTAGSGAPSAGGSAQSDTSSTATVGLVWSSACCSS
jgi:phage shock protein C